MRIAQVNTYDIAGGAERISRELHLEYLRRGHDSWLLVGSKRDGVERVVEIPNTAARGRWASTWSALADKWAPFGHDVTPGWHMRRAAARAIGEPDRALARALGREDFDYPGSAMLLGLVPRGIDIVHAHNLHGGALADRGYFDLRLLTRLSRERPLVLTLHDAWLLSGHCAHSFDCTRWQHGCGDCPDLTIYPALKRDGTAWNWRRKQRIYAESRLYVATPCEWLMRKVERSMLAPALVETRVIPYGVDLRVFRPAKRADARAKLGLPTEGRILLFAANGIRRSEWKDYRTLRAALALVAERLDDHVTLVALGETADPERVGRAEIRFEPYRRSAADVASYFQAADVYVHAALVETFPSSILEALACAIPVVASAVGGIPEQVTPRTGVLVKPQDAEALATAVERLLRDEQMRRVLGDNAAADARERFALSREADAYLRWYDDMLGHCPSS